MHSLALALLFVVCLGTRQWNLVVFGVFTCQNNARLLVHAGWGARRYRQSRRIATSVCITHDSERAGILACRVLGTRNAQVPEKRSLLLAGGALAPIKSPSCQLAVDAQLE